ncbi:MULTISPECIES: hypothetical protein [Paraburkholderia]|jgi:hypothetical protein|uniref:Uncharacterized protein n=1 Tax=Paraburkholderia phenazinium TaxID=60549 RepID=A0A1N6KM99_9BURK|nr:hypothetical protein [Paraburkholderia phenazinium]SIO57671.1 hypothetical protein SAMN05444165_3923 [Paraburkholderia phenazinium]
MMRNKQRSERVRFIVACGVMGGLAVSKFFGWIDRSVDMQTIGVVIGAGVGSLRVFTLV